MWPELASAGGIYKPGILCIRRKTRRPLGYIYGHKRTRVTGFFPEPAKATVSGSPCRRPSIPLTGLSATPVFPGPRPAPLKPVRGRRDAKVPSRQLILALDFSFLENADLLAISSVRPRFALLVSISFLLDGFGLPLFRAGVFRFSGPAHTRAGIGPAREDGGKIVRSGFRVGGEGDPIKQRFGAAGNAVKNRVNRFRQDFSDFQPANRII